MRVSERRDSGGVVDIKQLRYFMGVLEAKSITKAAEQLYVAQPALGLQIRKLEEELGVELFVRHSRGVAPTEVDPCHSAGLVGDRTQMNVDR